jgi:hypothetical protein
MMHTLAIGFPYRMNTERATPHSALHSLPWAGFENQWQQNEARDRWDCND